MFHANITPSILIKHASLNHIAIYTVHEPVLI